MTNSFRANKRCTAAGSSSRRRRMPNNIVATIDSTKWQRMKDREKKATTEIIKYILKIHRIN